MSNVESNRELTSDDVLVGMLNALERATACIRAGRVEGLLVIMDDGDQTHAFNGVLTDRSEARLLAAAARSGRRGPK